MRVRECVFVCVRLHVCGAATEKRGGGAVIVRKTEQERERDKDLEKE